MSLELRNVEKKIGQETHIYETNLKLEKNTINVLLGSTLAGKTTLMQIMAGLDKPTNGEIWFNEKNVTGVKVQKRNVSMVYQQFINYPNFNVYDNIASPLKITGVDTNEIKNRVGKVAELLKLSPMLNKRPNELSGGQQQRTALARALVKDSDLILLDEPLANLDFKLREELREELPKLFEDRDCIVVYATTEPSDALMIGGNTATLLEGKVIQYGKTLDVYNRPENLISAKVFSDPPMNIAEIKKDANGNTYITDVQMTTVDPNDNEQVDNIMRLANSQRSVASTSMNEQSSRSHSVFRLHLKATHAAQNITLKGDLSLVDLAGSERAANTQNRGARLVEGANINRSLLALGNCINALGEKGNRGNFVPYRDSKLTRLLQNSLGGNAKTVMCANAGPADYNYDETLSTLRYANRAKNIKNKPKINEDPKDAMLREYQEEIKRLKINRCTILYLKD